MSIDPTVLGHAFADLIAQRGIITHAVLPVMMVNDHLEHRAENPPKPFFLVKNYKGHLCGVPVNTPSYCTINKVRLDEKGVWHLTRYDDSGCLNTGLISLLLCTGVASAEWMEGNGSSGQCELISEEEASRLWASQEVF